MRPATTARQAAMVGVALVSLGIGLVQWERHGGSAGRVARLGIAPLQGLATLAGQAVRGFFQGYIDLVQVEEENQTLRAALKANEAELARLADLAAENERLRLLIGLADKRKDLRLRAARVVSRSNSSHYRVMRLVLDVGSDGVKPGMPVIAPGGVVGQVHTIVGSRAEVLLVTDPRSAVDVVLEKSRARGVAVGTGEPECYAARLEYLERSVQALPKERVLTTGDDGRYPRGLVLGEVMGVDGTGVESGPFQIAQIAPLVDLSALEEVFVVLGTTGLTPEGDAFEEPPKAESDAGMP